MLAGIPKPLNVWDLKRDIIYKNDERYDLMRSLWILQPQKMVAGAYRRDDFDESRGGAHGNVCDRRPCRADERISLLQGIGFFRISPKLHYAHAAGEARRFNARMTQRPGSADGKMGTDSATVLAGVARWRIGRESKIKKSSRKEQR